MLLVPFALAAREVSRSDLSHGSVSLRRSVACGTSTRPK
jgi:hypothetical protein